MTEPLKPENIVSFVDGARSVIGEHVLETPDVLHVKNPATVHLQPTESGQIQVQLFPYWFSELLSAKQREEGIVWVFNKSTISHPVSQIELDERLVDQYNRTFGYIKPSNIIAPNGGEKIIKLFDD